MIHVSGGCSDRLRVTVITARVWLTAEKELTALGFARTNSVTTHTRNPPLLVMAGSVFDSRLRACVFVQLNHTKAAVIARDEDEDRVNSYAAHLYSQYPAAFQMPVRGEMCRKVVDRLLLNFYRHPGTALYEKMVTGCASEEYPCAIQILRFAPSLGPL